jgi:hypothetical protein
LFIASIAISFAREIISPHLTRSKNSLLEKFASLDISCLWTYITSKCAPGSVRRLFSSEKQVLGFDGNRADANNAKNVLRKRVA